MVNSDLTRRELLKRGAGALLATGFAGAAGYLLHDPRGDARLHTSRPPVARGLPNFFAGVDFPGASPRLSIAIGSEERIGSMVRAAVAGLDPALGMGRFLRRGDVVLIKPNVGFDRPPHLGATTHPEVLRWVIRLCREAGAAQVLVSDNPIEAAAVCFSKSGIRRVAEEEGARVVLPTPGSFAPLALGARPAGREPRALADWPALCEPLLRSNKLIGVAPVKDHNLCSASMCLKNWYGFLGGRRNQLHQAIHEVISDLAVLFSPTLVFADATRVMMHNGPTGGRTSDVKPGGALGRPAVIAAVDPVACDAWCYQHLLGRDATRPLYLELAHRKIGEQIAGGQVRFAEQDWHVYQRAGLIATTSL